VLRLRPNLGKVNVTGEQWVTGVITELLETTHGQWLYRCVQVHDRFSGIQATQRKEELQMAMEAQQDMGWEDLTEEDQYLAEVNLEDLEHTSGERQEYWQVAIQAAWEASRLQGLSQSNVGRRRTARRGCAHTQLLSLFDQGDWLSIASNTETPGLEEE